MGKGAGICVMLMGVEKAKGYCTLGYSTSIFIHTRGGSLHMEDG